MTYDANKLVAVYIKMRDRKAELNREHEERIREIDENMSMIENELLEVCKTTGQDGGKTMNGSFTRTVKTRYWTNNWGAMYDLIKRHDAIELLEQRISQTNMKTFLQQHPNEVPDGLNVDSRYSITVRRPTGK